MIKNHKWKAIISSVVILLPILFGVIFWNQLPDSMVSHWGADGVADGMASKTFMVFGFPLILLALHWLMLLLTTMIEKNSKPQGGKIITLSYAIIPAASLMVHIVMYSIALGKDWDLFTLVPLFLGAMFVCIGNYLPKTSRNKTFGIKLPWTWGNDENWNLTHRLGGKLWFWGGWVIMVSALFAAEVAVIVMFIVILAAIVVPTVYSYSIYKKHNAEGIKYESVLNKKSDKTAIRITAVAVPLILIGVGVLMFTGNIEVKYSDEDFQIVASYMDDLTVRYEDVDSVEYREEFSVGFREMGYASGRLSMGTFKNDEFGRYTLYAYTQGEGAVILRSGEKVLVIVAQTAAETKGIYETILAKIHNLA